MESGNNNDNRSTPSPSHKPETLYDYEEEEDDGFDVLALLEATTSGQDAMAGVEQQYIVSPCASESSKDEDDFSGAEYQGEIDEGFDEEFDTEDPLAKEEGDPSLAPSFDMLNELNEKELQHLLAEDAMSAHNSLPLPNSMLLDDFDLGVDVLDSETSSHNLLASEPVKSSAPFSCIPTSPYQLVGTTSPVTTTVLAGSNLETLNQMNSYNSFMNAQNEGDMSVQSEVASEYPNYSSTSSSQGSSHGCTGDLEMLYSMVEGDTLATSQTGNTGFSISSTSGYQHSIFSSASDVTTSMYNPTLTSVATAQYPLPLDSNTLMDLTVASKLVQEEPFNSTVSSSSGLNFISCTTGGTVGSILTNGECSTNTESYSKGSQTVNSASTLAISDTTHLLSSENTNSDLSSSPDSPPVRSKPRPIISSSSLPPSSPITSSYGSPTPSPYSTGACGYSPIGATNGSETSEPFLFGASDDESDSESVSSSLPYTNRELISMQFYKFKKILDSNSVSVSDKDLIKAIRRRGKNKVAAKNCRQKKLGAICSLQQEIEQLKSLKKRLTIKTQSLEREISSCKQTCSRDRSASQR